jgi:hypothetical protein
MGKVQLFVSDIGHDNLIKLDVTDLKNLALQSAASLIALCEVYPTDGSTPRNSDIADVLMTRVDYIDFPQLTNGLVVQAEILYACVKDVIKRRSNSSIGIVLNPPDAKLIAEALQKFQEWKTKVCEHERSIHDKDWKSATEFFQKDWSDLNYKFLRLY